MLGHHRYHAGMLAGRVVLVAGGGTGVGQSIARGLEDADATVVVVDGGFASRKEADIAFAGARDATGPIDAVVHAFVDPAALTNAPLADTPEADWDRRCEATLRAALYTIQAAAQELWERGGPLVLVTPTIAFTGAPGLVPYSAAAEGMRALAKSAARQWGERRITVSCVAVPVELMATVPAAGPTGLALTEPALGRDPDARRDVARVVALLVSDPAPFVTGVTIPVDGGVVMAP
jgi:NAD(P)-dependent dehydrogenase (short-subunit alcohol dehydrogenase family)